MRPIFSLLHASFGRPEKAIAAMRMWYERATMPDAVEYIFALNYDDPTALDLIAALDEEEKSTKRPIHVIQAHFSGSAPAWDAAACASEGEILVQVSDDFDMPDAWDMKIYTRLEFAVPLGNKPAVVRVAEHYRRDALMTMAVMNRKYYEMQGEFLHSGFQSVFSDDDFTIRCLSNAAEGKCVLVDATDVTFRHESPYHTGAPHDDTLRRQNSSEAYAKGGELFVYRNSKLIAAGLKTW